VWAPESGFGVKTAEVQPTNGEIVETTTRRRVLPVADLTPGARSTPEYWEYLATLDKNPEEWERHLVYLYRVDPKPSTPVDKCTQFMAMPDGQRILMSDKEEIEFAIARRWGGRDFRFIVKRGGERITETHVIIDAPPRPIAPLESSNGNGNGNGAGATVTPYQSGTMSEAGSTAYVAGQAMHALTNQERQSAEIGFRAMETAANVMQRFAAPAANGTGGDDLTRQFMQAMIARMMAPPPDPIDTLVKLLTVTRELGGGGGTGGGGGAAAPLVDRILTTALDRFVNPTPSGPPVSASAELVRQLPQVAMTAVEGLREWRAGMEAQRDTVIAAQRGVPQPNRPALPAQAQPQPAPNPNPPGATAVQPPSLEFLETKIMEFWREPISTTEAAEKALDFLTLTAPDALEHLAGLGETGLTQLFGSRQILKPATQNMSRLLEFIRALLKMHAEDKAESDRKPN
jgi:hypothetical protein